MDDDALSVEERKNGANATPKLLKHGEYLLISDPKGRLIDEYIEGKKSIAFRNRNGSGFGHSTQYGFVIAALDGRACPRKPPGISEVHHSVNARLGTYQTLMLPYDVQVMEKPERFVPSFVRFERFDDRSLLISKPLFSFFVIQPMERIDHIEFASEDWKVPIAIRDYAVALDQGSGEEIEGAWQRADDRPDPSIEAERERLFLVGYNQIITRLRISLTSQAVGATLLPFVEGILEQWDLGIGPIDGSLSI
jgi:hypothetical protein